MIGLEYHYIIDPKYLERKFNLKKIHDYYIKMKIWGHLNAPYIISGAQGGGGGEGDTKIMVTIKNLLKSLY